MLVPVASEEKRKTRGNAKKTKMKCGWHDELNIRSLATYLVIAELGLRLAHDGTDSLHQVVTVQDGGVVVANLLQ